MYGVLQKHDFCLHNYCLLAGAKTLPAFFFKQEDIYHVVNRLEYESDLSRMCDTFIVLCNYLIDLPVVPLLREIRVALTT
jgi:hypothetical protein